MMDSDHHHHSQQQQQQYQYQHHFQDLQRALQPPRLLQQQPTSGGGGGGLTRYRSAPSSYFASYLDTIDTSSVMINNNSSSSNNEKHDFNQPRPLSPETESIIAKFMNSVDGGGGGSSDPLPTKLCDIPENSPVQGAEFMVSVKREAQQIIQPTELLQQQTIQQQPIQQQHQTNFSSSPQVIYSPNKPPLAKQNLNNSPVSSNSSVENSPFGTSSSMFMDSIKINGSISSASNHGSSSFRASLDSINPTTSQQMMIGVGGSGMSPKPGIPSPFRNPISGNGTSSSASSPFRSPTTTMDSLNQQMMKSGSGLVRHSSLPAGFLANINLDDGFAALRNMGTNNTNKNNSNRASNNDSSFATPGRLNGQMNFSSGLPSSSNGIDHRSFTNSIKSNNCNNNGSNENGDGYLTGFPIGSWDDSMLLSNDFSNLDDDDDDDHKGFSDLNSSENNNQNREAGNRPPALLAHHLSLPKNAMEKLLHFQDSVPCKIRAKRGMATHPRSIAERVRRTKISERMRKLQDLVPYMDKQTNTADMLDLAVEYIKDLQKQVKVLADNRARCTCSS